MFNMYCNMEISVRQKNIVQGFQAPEDTQSPLLDYFYH